MSITENNTYSVKKDVFCGELFRPSEDKYSGKALICFSGSDGGIELARTLAGVFQAKGLTTLALAYAIGEGLPEKFSRIPIDMLEAAAKRLHDMGCRTLGHLKGCGNDNRLQCFCGNNGGFQRYPHGLLHQGSERQQRRYRD